MQRIARVCGCLLCGGDAGHRSCEIWRTTRVGHGEGLEVYIDIDVYFLLLGCTCLFVGWAVGVVVRSGCDAQEDLNKYVVVKGKDFYICIYSELEAWQPPLVSNLFLCLYIMSIPISTLVSE